MQVYSTYIHVYCIYLNYAAPLSGTTVYYYYLSTNNLVFVINFNYSAPLNSVTYADLTGVNDSKLYVAFKVSPKIYIFYHNKNYCNCLHLNSKFQVPTHVECPYSLVCMYDPHILQS